MNESIMESMLALLTPEMKQALAERLKESPQSVGRGLAAAAAALLDALASKAEDAGYLAQILGFVRGATGQDVLSDLPYIASDGPTGATADLVNRFLPTVFGSRQSQVASVIARQCRLRASSAAGLVRMAVPLLLAFFSKAQTTGMLDARTFADLLRGEAPKLSGHLPRGRFGSAAAPATSPRWLLAAAIAGTLLLVWLVIRSLTAPQERASVATMTAAAGENAAPVAAPAAWAALGDMMKMRLPDGSELSVPALGVEARLVRFLNDGAASASENSWFDFDRLLFDTGKATLQPPSREQLANIAAILKAYPLVRIRIGGYTDNTGDPAANLRLSEERANNVMGGLVILGIDPVRMSARGYGADSPVADNSTEEGRQKNRRISLRVTDKQASA